MKNKQFTKTAIALALGCALSTGIAPRVVAEDGLDHDVDNVETTDTEVEKTLGVGEESIVEALSDAQASALLEEGATDADGNVLDIDTALVEAEGQIMEMRESGMGWGQIANQLGFKLGHVISDFKNSRPEHAQRPEERSAQRPEKLTRVERSQRPERIERAERPQRPERIERAQRPERPERPERPNR